MLRPNKKNNLNTDVKLSAETFILIITDALIKKSQKGTISGLFNFCNLILTVQKSISGFRTIYIVYSLIFMI